MGFFSRLKKPKHDELGTDEPEHGGTNGTQPPAVPAEPAPSVTPDGVADENSEPDKGEILTSSATTLAEDTLNINNASADDDSGQSKEDNGATDVHAKDAGQAGPDDPTAGRATANNSATLLAADLADGHQDAAVSESLAELATLTKKIQSVKDEYSISVRDLMSVKKDLHQKRDELEAAAAKLQKLEKEIVTNGDLASKTAADLGQKQNDLAKMRDDLAELQKEYDDLANRLEQERHALTVIKTQQSEAEGELEEANARLYNAKAELESREQFQDPSIFTDDEKKTIQDAAGSSATPAEDAAGTAVSHDGSSKDEADSREQDLRSHASVVEAAGVVVASLKSKLKTTQNELEAVHLLLKQEREQHDATKQQLASILEGKDS